MAGRNTFMYSGAFKHQVVREVESALEGQVFEDLLQEAGIPAMVSPSQDPAFDGYESTSKGWGRVIVLIEDKEAAETLIKEEIRRIKDDLDD